MTRRGEWAVSGTGAQMVNPLKLVEEREIVAALQRE